MQRLSVRKPIFKKSTVSTKRRTASRYKLVQSARPTLSGATGEKKFFDTVRAAHTPAVAGTISNLSLNLIPQGVTESTRVGRKCRIMNLNIRGTTTISASSSSNATDTSLRMIVYLDKQSNGATAAVTDILRTADFFSFNNLSNSSRFSVITDKVFDLKAMSGAGNGTADNFGQDIISFQLYKQLDCPIEFSGINGTIDEIRSNNLGVLAIQTSAVGTLQYTARVRFLDG